MARSLQVAHLMRVHGLTLNQARLIANIHYGDTTDA